MKSETTSSSPPTPRKKDVLETRVSAHQKALFERAAALRGQKLSDFVITALQDAAQRAIHQHEVMELSENDAKVFVEALLKSPPLNEHLKRAAETHRRLLRRP